MQNQASGDGGSAVSVSFLGRVFLSTRNARVVSMEQGQEQGFNRFQAHVAARLVALLPSPSAGAGVGVSVSDSHHQSAPLLSLPFLSKLLDAFLSCDEEFRSLLARNHAALLSKTPADRAVTDFLERTVKSLDVCNATSLALDAVRQWHRYADSAASAILPDHNGDGPLNRASRALAKLLPFSPDAPAGRGEGSGSSTRFNTGHLRPIPWSVTRSSTSGRDMPPVPAQLANPRGGETGGAGMALAVYAMSSVLAFTMWALAAAFRGHDRGAVAPSSPVSPRQHLPWAGTIAVLQDRVTEEWRSRKGTAGLLVEVQALERCGRGLMEAVGEAGAQPLQAEVVARAADLAEACRRLEEGLGPLERQVREVFHRVVCSRSEVIRCVDQSRAAPQNSDSPLVS